eukprot:366552-Chlamydomonas_euryale.AAC.12
MAGYPFCSSEPGSHVTVGRGGGTGCLRAVRSGVLFVIAPSPLFDPLCLAVLNTYPSLHAILTLTLDFEGLQAKAISACARCIAECKPSPTIVRRHQAAANVNGARDVRQANERNRARRQRVRVGIPAHACENAGSTLYER